MDSPDATPPEVTIEPADNGHVVRWHQRSTKKDQSGRTVRRVASTVDEALSHAKSALGGGGKSAMKSAKKKSPSRSAGATDPEGDASAKGIGVAESTSMLHSHTGRSRGRRRPVRSRRRG